jgi:hypothetical protein
MSGATIFCSRCGAPGQRFESYCRSCGEWLPDPSAAMTPRGRLRRLSPERKQRRMRALELLSAAAALVAGLLTLSVLTGADLERLVVAMLLCFAVVGWQMVAFFMGRSIQRRQNQTAAEGDPPLPTAQAGAGARPVLDAADTRGLVPPPSVTENTTALLDHVPVKRGEKR